MSIVQGHMVNKALVQNLLSLNKRWS